MKGRRDGSSRREFLRAAGAALGLAAGSRAVAILALPLSPSSPAKPLYDWTAHEYAMLIDLARCIGCGHCVQACKLENDVPREPTYFRTWVERYIITKPKLGSGAARGETLVDCPNGGINGYPEAPVLKEEIQHSFFVPKLCNLCKDSPCTQVCPVGATFDAPDGAVLIDPKYCIGCGFCIQACPYGCRFINPETKTVEKCTLCYHRITQGLTTACSEACPTGARTLVDLKNPKDPVHEFLRNNSVQVLKPQMATGSKVFYKDLDGAVR